MSQSSERKSRRLSHNLPDRALQLSPRQLKWSRAQNGIVSEEFVRKSQYLLQTVQYEADNIGADTKKGKLCSVDVSRPAIINTGTVVIRIIVGVNASQTRKATNIWAKHWCNSRFNTVNSTVEFQPNSLIRPLSVQVEQKYQHVAIHKCWREHVEYVVEFDSWTETLTLDSSYSGEISACYKNDLFLTPIGLFKWRGPLSGFPLRTLSIRKTTKKHQYFADWAAKPQPGPRDETTGPPSRPPVPPGLAHPYQADQLECEPHQVWESAGEDSWY